MLLLLNKGKKWQLSALDAILKILILRVFCSSCATPLPNIEDVRKRLAGLSE